MVCESNHSMREPGNFTLYSAAKPQSVPVRLARVWAQRFPGYRQNRSLDGLGTLSLSNGQAVLLLARMNPGVRRKTTTWASSLSDLGNDILE